MLVKQREYALQQPGNCFCTHARNPIVIVDDSSDDLSLLSLYLKSFVSSANPVITLHGGQELLTYLTELEMENIEAVKFESEIPAMVFLDLLMPKMDGAQTLSAVRRQPIWDDMPITLMTCSRDNTAISRAEKAGANSFLAKPFKKPDVVRTLMKSDYFFPPIM